MYRRFEYIALNFVTRKCFEWRMISRVYWAGAHKNHTLYDFLLPSTSRSLIALDGRTKKESILNPITFILITKALALIPWDKTRMLLAHRNIMR